MSALLVPKKKLILARRSLLLAAPAILLGRSALASINFAPHLQTYVEFSGGPIASLGTITAGSGYTPGTYTGCALTGAASGATGAVATIVVNADGTMHAGAVTITATGPTQGPAGGYVGYQVTDVLTSTDSRLGAGTGFAVAVATVATLSWTVPPNLYGAVCDAISGGGAGGAGGTLSGGGGGQAGPEVLDFPISFTPLAVLTITAGAPGVAGAGGTTNITGAITLFPPQSVSVSGLSGGIVGTAGSGTTGGPGGGAASRGGGAGGAAGAIGSNSTFTSTHFKGGSGGGGGGGSAAAGGFGGGANTYAIGSPGVGNASGGGGGCSDFGNGGKGGGGTTPSPGLTGTGWGGGGGGGGPSEAGGNGSPGWVRFRF